MEARYIRLEQLANETQLPLSWLRREADSGRLPCLRTGRARWFDLDAVLRALSQRSGKGGTSRAK